MSRVAEPAGENILATGRRASPARFQLSMSCDAVRRLRVPLRFRSFRESATAQFRLCPSVVAGRFWRRFRRGGEATASLRGFLYANGCSQIALGCLLTTRLPVAVCACPGRVPPSVAPWAKAHERTNRNSSWTGPLITRSAYWMWTRARYWGAKAGLARATYRHDLQHDRAVEMLRSMRHNPGRDPLPKHRRQ